MTPLKQGITAEDFARLAAPFPARDHEFNRGFIYISEEAICARMEQVDLSWEWKVVEMSYDNDMATVVGALTICGVTRYGTGQQLAQIDAKSGKESVGESRKGATTDALKRAARLFGIGRYLLQCPKTVKDHGRELDTWLANVANGTSASVPAPSPQSTRPTSEKQQAAPAPASTPSNGNGTASALLDYQDAEQALKFLAWVKDAFGYGEADVIAALRPLLKDGRYKVVKKVVAIAHVLAYAGGYTQTEIKSIGKERQLSDNTISEALLIAAPEIPF